MVRRPGAREGAVGREQEDLQHRPIRPADVRRHAGAFGGEVNGRNRKRCWGVHMTTARVFFVKQEKFRTSPVRSINFCEYLQIRVNWGVPDDNDPEAANR